MRLLLALFLSLLATSAFAQSVPTTATTAPANGLVLAVGSGVTMYGFQIYSDTGGLAMLFDASSIPGNGAVTPKKCYPVAAGTSVALGYFPFSMVMSTGAVVAFGTNTGGGTCYNLVKQNANFISGEAQ